MIWNKVKAEQTILVKVPKVEEPVKVLVGSGLSKEERKNYIQTALSIGIQGSSLLKIILEELGYEIYPYGKVCDYLDSMLGVAPSVDYWQQKWGWRGLRLEDLDHQIRASTTSERNCRLMGPYELAIPAPVLNTIVNLQNEIKKLGNPMVLDFFVSDVLGEKDEPDRSKDPFLAVVSHGSAELFVIERWDEPGFRL